MSFKTSAMMLLAATLAFGCDMGSGDADKDSDKSSSKKSSKKKKKKGEEGDTKEAADEGAKTIEGKAPEEAVTSPSQQSYPEDGITKIADNCSSPFVIMSTAPNSVGVDYEWTWTRQAMLANQQFKVVDGEPAGPGQVSFQLHLASDRFNNAFVLVAKCKDGGTCNKLAAMYKGVLKNSQSQPVCGKLPMDLSPATLKKPVLRAAGFSANTLPDAKDAKGLCARLQACTVAMDPPSKAGKESIGFDCQKAPSNFKTACARKYPCAEVMKCLGNDPDVMSRDDNFALIETDDGVPIKAWVRGVALEDAALEQLLNVAKLPIVYKHVAAMPDVHWGLGATVGSVIPTLKAIIPAAVGVDIGCGMMAARTNLRADQLPDNLSSIRRAIERAVPHGRTHHGGSKDEGSFRKSSAPAEKEWRRLGRGYERIIDNYPSLDRGKTVQHLGTLGTGNHFIEVCLDKEDRVWLMLHSGSRGVGNRIGSHFIALAKKDMRKHIANLPHEDLAYFEEGADHFDDYVFAVQWAQDYARTNRELMMEAVVKALQSHPKLPKLKASLEAVNCHHNYVTRETHFGREVFVTRKGAVRAGKGDMGIIPGSMGARSFIVRGLGNPESFESCSHGAGRAMSRRKAKRIFTVEDHAKATAGIECRKDEDVLDETPGAYKPIDKVMAAQQDLVEIVHELRQVVCVKG